MSAAAIGRAKRSDTKKGLETISGMISGDDDRRGGGVSRFRACNGEPVRAQDGGDLVEDRASVAGATRHGDEPVRRVEEAVEIDRFVEGCGKSRGSVHAG